MILPSFDVFQSQIQALYKQGEYSKALELATQITGRFPEQMPLINYWQFCMAARVGKLDLSLRILTRTLAGGFWYSEPLLRKSPSLQSLQGNSDFERLVEQNRQQQMQDQDQIFPLIVLRQQSSCQDSDNSCPLLVALHANASTAQASVDFWKPAASTGWLVAIPQSSQAMWKDAYIWDDFETAQEEVQRHFASLEAQYAIDSARVVIAGHSMGGKVAIRLALTGALDACGFIALEPGEPFTGEIESWNDLIAQAQERFSATGAPPLRGYIIYGEEDHAISPAGIQDLVQRLVQAGIDCKVDSLPGAGHDYHPVYAAAFLRALDFIHRQA